MNKPVQTSLLDCAMARLSTPAPQTPEQDPQIEPVAKTQPPSRPSTPEPARWGVDDPDVIIRSQPAMAVYENVYGAIVIRQEASLYEEDDPYVVVQQANLPALIATLKQYLSGA